jgi:hypothetical protein
MTGMDVYPSLLGNLLYAAVWTRPYVSTALSTLGSTRANPTEAHLQALKKVVRYLHGTIDMRLTFGGGYAPQSPTYMLCRRGLGQR